MPEPVTVDELRSLGAASGLHAVGVAPAARFERALSAMHERLEAGLTADLGFTYRNPERATDPGAAVRDAAAVVVGARRYLRAEPPRPGGSVGRVARYARADHYGPLRASLWDLARHLRSKGWRAVAFADDNSLVDREAAWLGGLGWFGKNANLLVPGVGSWVVLGAVVTDCPLPVATEPVPDGCGPCRRCLDACPTGAIVAPGVVDANRCLAWLVQRPGTFPERFRAALGDRLYGCDDCQEVCPPSRTGELDETDDASLTWPDLAEVVLADDATLLERFGRWYLADRDPRWLRRNALIAIGNVGDPVEPRVVSALRAGLTAPDPILRAHAVWAAARLGRHDLVALVPAGDPDPEVRAELAAASVSSR